LLPARWEVMGPIGDIGSFRNPPLTITLFKLINVASPEEGIYQLTLFILGRTRQTIALTFGAISLYLHCDTCTGF
jgi:hypothetical protein